MTSVCMIETIINYKDEYLRDENGRLRLFKFDPRKKDYFRNQKGDEVPADDGKPYYVDGEFARNEKGELVPDTNGLPFKLWRPALNPELNPDRKAWAGINSPQDIWNEILKAGEIPGTTSAPKLQPIAARIVMLQSGMRAPMGVKIKGPDLKTIEKTGLELEKNQPELEWSGETGAGSFIYFPFPTHK